MSDEKPQYLYHGTCYLIGDAIEPQLCPGDINGDFKDGKRKLTFAADDTRQSKIFSFNIASPDSANIKFLMESGYTGSESGITWSAAFINRKGLEEAVKHFTPTVYTVDSAPFTQNMRDGRPTGEWVSPETVKPVSKQAVTMEDILQDGTQIFFVGHPHITKDVWNRTRQKHLKDWKFEPGDGPLAYYAALKREGRLHLETY